MFAALRMFWSTLATFFEGIQVNARTFLHLSTIGEQNALAYAEKSTHERESALAAYRLKAAKQQAKIAAV
jgi:hypothetical protein